MKERFSTFAEACRGQLVVRVSGRDVDLNAPEPKRDYMKEATDALERLGDDGVEPALRQIVTDTLKSSAKHHPWMLEQFFTAKRQWLERLRQVGWSGPRIEGWE